MVFRVLAVIMLGFYATCIVFVFVILGLVLKLATGVNLFSLLKYLGREFLLILSTSSSETALPRLIGKMEHVGVQQQVVGLTVPTGYSFNLDGTAIYLTMASLFIAEALGDPLSIGEQISLLVFMIIASKGAAGVTGNSVATVLVGSWTGSLDRERLDRVLADDDPSTKPPCSTRSRPTTTTGKRRSPRRGDLAYLHSGSLALVPPMEYGVA